MNLSLLMDVRPDRGGLSMGVNQLIVLGALAMMLAIILILVFVLVLKRIRRRQVIDEHNGPIGSRSGSKIS